MPLISFLEGKQYMISMHNEISNQHAISQRDMQKVIQLDKQFKIGSKILNLFQMSHKNFQVDHAPTNAAILQRSSLELMSNRIK